MARAVCRVLRQEVAVGPAQVPGEELPPLLQTPLRQVRRRRAVEREAAPQMAVLVRRVGHPVAEEEGADLETTGLPIFHTLPAGLEERSLPWPCKVDKRQ